MKNVHKQWDVWQIRKDFPILQKPLIKVDPPHTYSLVYLDSAATAQKPRSVIDAITQFYQEEYATVHRSVYGLASLATTRYTAVRQAVQHFLQAALPEEIVFTKGTTEGINLVASSFGKAYIHPGDEVIISTAEHHSNIIPWQLLCQERGAHLKVIPVNERGELILEEYEKLLTEKTKIVSIAHMANSTGVIHPIEKMIPMAHAKGAKFLVDGAQSVAHLPIDVQKLDADFFVFSGHKLFGPTGIGILYGKKALLEEMPPYQGGGDMVDQVLWQGTSYQPPPLKFEAGTPLIAEVMGLGAAIDYVQALDKEQIATWEQLLLEYATAKLTEIPGLQIIGTSSYKGPIISFIVQGIHPLDIGTLLDLKGIAVRTGHHCAQPTMHHFGIPATVRVSFALYNTFEEIDLFLHALKEAITLLSS